MKQTKHEKQYLHIRKPDLGSFMLSLAFLVTAVWAVFSLNELTSYFSGFPSPAFYKIPLTTFGMVFVISVTVTIGLIGIMTSFCYTEDE